MVVTLKSYLERLAEDERARSGDRKDVPTLTELAEAAGVTKGSVSKFANGGFQSMSFAMATGILDELNRRGFTTKLEDIIRYYPPES